MKLFLLSLSLVVAGCSNSVATAPATVAPSPLGIPLVAGGEGTAPIPMYKGDTQYTISFPMIDILTESPGYKDIPEDSVLVVFDVVYEVQTGSLDVVGSSDFEAYLDGTEAAESASFGFGLDEIGYVTLLSGTKARGQFGYVFPRTSSTLVLYFVDKFSSEPRLWQMNLDVRSVIGD